MFAAKAAGCRQHVVLVPTSMILPRRILMMMASKSSPVVDIHQEIFFICEEESRWDCLFSEEWRNRRIRGAF
jgi:hypothetical protein